MGVESVGSSTVFQGVSRSPDKAEAAEVPGRDHDGDKDDTAGDTTTIDAVKSPTSAQVGNKVDVSA